MNEKRREKLLTLYFDLADAEHYYKSSDEYTDYLSDIHTRFCESRELPDQIKTWMTFLHGRSSHRPLYLGIMRSLEQRDWSRLHDALAFTSVAEQLNISDSGYDHCIYGWNLLPLILSANRWEDIPKIFPRESGLSVNGHRVCKAVTNLVMYLYYREGAWKKAVQNEGRHILEIKETVESKAVVSCLLHLTEENFEGFSASLSDVCKGKKRSHDFGESKFTREFSFFALGLLNLCYYLFPDSPDRVTLPADENFPMDLHIYQKQNHFAPGTLPTFKSPLELVNDILRAKLPVMHLCGSGKKQLTDVSRYREDFVNAVLDGRK